MDDPVRTPTEYLESRLRERRAVARHAPLGPPSFTTPTSAKDDDIFTFDFDPATKRIANDRTVSSSPLSHAYSRATSQSRGPSSRTTASSQARDMGARQAEQQMERLSKENFDLKLELFHRRHKYAELEKRLQALENAESEIEALRLDNKRLRADNADLTQANREADAVIVHQEEAIDEAVVKIIELEEALQRGAADLTRRSTQLHAPPVQIPDHLHVTPPSKSNTPDTIPAAAEPREKLSLDTAVDAAAQVDHQVLHVPSFIHLRDPSTQALRTIFMDGDRQIRAIPSRYSVLSGCASQKDTATNDDGSPRSPQLSELSESEFKSIYGRDTPRPLKSPSLLPEDLPTSPDTPVHFAQARRFERTNRWVSDRAVTPCPESPRKRRAPSAIPEQGQESPAKAQEPPARSMLIPPSPARSREPPLQASRPVSRSTQFLGPQVGLNHYPPTPDTMATRKQSNASLSLVHDRSSNDCFDARQSSSHLDRIMQLQAEADMLAKERSIPELVSEFDEYLRTDEYREDFGAALFRLDDYCADDYGVDEPSLTLEETNRHLPHTPVPDVPRHSHKTSAPAPADRHLTQPHQDHLNVKSGQLGPGDVPVRPASAMYGAAGNPHQVHRSQTAASPTRPPTRALRRSNSIDATSPPSNKPPPAAAMARMRNRSATPQRPVSWHHGPGGPLAAAVDSGSAIPQRPPSRATPGPQTTSTAIPYYDGTPTPTHQRQSSLKQRMLAFANLGPADHNADADTPKSQPETHTPKSRPTPTDTPKSTPRRFFPRRAGKPLPCVPNETAPGADPSAQPSDDSTKVGHKRAILAAAQHAAPFLSFDLNKGARSGAFPGGSPQSTAGPGGGGPHHHHHHQEGRAPTPPPHSANSGDSTPHKASAHSVRTRGLSGSKYSDARGSNLLTFNDGTMGGWRPRSRDGWGVK